MEDNKNDAGTLTVEELQAQLQALQNKLAEKDSKITELDDDRKKMIERREQVKREAEQVLIEQEKFKDAYEQLKKDYDEYKGSWNEEKYNSVKTELDNFVNKQKELLLSKLDENDKKTFADLPLDKLTVVVEKLSGQTVNVDTSTRHTTGSNTSKKWEDMNEKERLELTNADPAKAKKLLTEFLSKKKTT